jgi:hypothetical protein
MKKIMLTCSFCVLGLLLQKSLMGQDRRDSAATGQSDPIVDSAGRHKPDATSGRLDLALNKLDSSLQKPAPKKSYWQGGLSYLSDNVYLGRKDSVKIPYVMPTIGYYHKSGLYADATLGYAVLPGNSHIDMFSLEAGYALTKGNFDGQLSASKFYYSSESYSVRSDIDANIVLDAAYDLRFIKPTFEATLNFGSSTTDYVLTWGLQHTFYAAGDAIDITPSVLMNMGTQNYYDSYYRNRKYSTKRKNGTTVKGTITATVIDPSAFKTMDYEASVPINYTLGKFTFNFTPTLAIPVNPAEVTRVTKPTGGGATSKVVALEKLNNSFYWTFGFLVKF